MTQRDILRAAELLQDADALIIAAGAGIGVDSGLPDFRGSSGFWRAYPALQKAGLDFSSIASPAEFRAHPQRAWGFYGHRLALYRQTIPHDGFTTLRNWAHNTNFGATVFTSNVDGQFQKAGFADKGLHECHGSIHHLQCLDRCHEGIWSADGFVPEVDQEHCLLLNEPPHCPHCGGLARPNILMFGDWDWLEQRSGEQERRQEYWLSNIRRPLVIELGAGTQIPSVRHFSQRIVHEFNGRLIRINPREFQVPTQHDVGLALGALDGINAIAQALK
jgi:NAD-dependent SIR2 family protein deacetylase